MICVAWIFLVKLCISIPKVDIKLCYLSNLIKYILYNNRFVKFQRCSIKSKRWGGGEGVLYGKEVIELVALIKLERKQANIDLSRSAGSAEVPKVPKGERVNRRY